MNFIGNYIKIVDGKIQYECDWCHKITKNCIHEGGHCFCSETCVEQFKVKRNNHDIINDVMRRQAKQRNNPIK